MSYYIKIGDINTEIPKCCNECQMCQDKFGICHDCSLLEQYNDGYFSLWNLLLQSGCN